MPLHLWRHDNGTWYVRGTVTVWRGGRPVPQRLRRSTRTGDEAEADAIRRQIENAAAEQNVTGRQPVVDFQTAAARYLRQGGEARFLTIPIARLGRCRIDDIDQAVLDAAALAAYPASPATRRRQFYAPVIAVLRAAGVLTPFRRPPDAGRRTFFLTPEQAVAVLCRIAETRYPNPWAPALATFLFATGARVGEALAVDGRDLSLDHGYCLLRDHQERRGAHAGALPPGAGGAVDAAQRRPAGTAVPAL